MKNRTLLTIALSLTAVMLFFVMLNSGRDTLERRAVLASARPVAVSDPSAASALVKAVDDEVMSPETPMELQYTRYPMSLVYFVVQGQSIPVYTSPNDDKQVIRQAEYREKLNYLETITIAGGGGGEEIWYQVYWYVGEKGDLLADGSDPEAQKCFGFIPEGSAEKRRYRIDAMMERVRKAEAFAAQGDIAHISNYQNGNGKPPLYKGQDTDAQGNRRSQSAPGYPDPAEQSEFTYLSDGTLVKVLALSVGADGGADPTGSSRSYRKVLSLNDDKTYYVPQRYLSDPHTLMGLSKAVVIDRKNQNEAAFEKKEDGSWVCVSYTLATTGKEGEYAVATPLGYYQMIEKRQQFYYYKDGTTEISGYAPFVLRFCGGAYIHGVPVPYGYEKGKRITPPHIEYSSTMGTVPLSHKCVRNYTSHAEFLWNWFQEGKTAVIVME